MPKEQRPPGCPVCGYDQSGEIARWEASCPTEGRCTECGSAFLWREVMRPEFGALREYVESTQEVRAPWRRRFTVTLVRSLIPPRLWSWVPRASPAAPARLAVYAVLATAAAYLIVVLPAFAWVGWHTTNGTLANYTSWSGRAIPPGPMDYVILAFNPVLTVDFPYASADTRMSLYFVSWTYIVSSVTIGGMALFARHRKIRIWHVVRGAALGIPVLLMAFLPLNTAVLLGISNNVYQTLMVWEMNILSLGVLEWWWWVVVRYIRTRRPRATATVYLFIPFLFSSPAAWLVNAAYETFLF